MKAPTVATDVGYGNTKAAFPKGSEVATIMFPSLAPLAAATTLAVRGTNFHQSRDVTTVTVGEAEYEVGPGVSLSSAYGHTGRTLSEDFVTKDEYAALLGGALHYANVTEIDQLVLGLPVHTTQKYSAFLRERFTGELDFGKRAIKVRSVACLPQPLGSLVTFMRQQGGKFDSDNAYLVIDFGYFTTDWVVARGFAMDDLRSGGVPGGAARVYLQIADLIAGDEGEPVSGIERIDKALRDNKPMLFYDKEIVLAPYLHRARSVCHAAVKEIQSKVGRTEDIRSIVLTGGGSLLYAPTIRAAFPRTPIHSVTSPCLANVRGFFDIGATWQSRHKG
ncbi:PRTRC system protein D [Ralstonia nicotianae]|uniref:PRTRC system protein D n=1 Tax=Ralstonia pseudosolanacearum TaxID=1310165 RepID=UPI0020058A7E|nr:PRTRC system protein D [Ralstonia pseudosolanacearum]MCK4118374.1 PRTRC system protein D [Ralstonia pseudosolanacearum]